MWTTLCPITNTVTAFFEEYDFIPDANRSVTLTGCFHNERPRNKGVPDVHSKGKRARHVHSVAETNPAGRLSCHLQTKAGGACAKLAAGGKAEGGWQVRSRTGLETVSPRGALEYRVQNRASRPGPG